MGESAGGGSIMHQITAFGGLPPDKTPFQHAILQSPAFFPTPSNDEQENTFQNFLKVANVSTIGEARSLSTEQLQSVNQAIIAQSLYGSFSFGPTVDDAFVPGLPGKLLLQGSYDPNLNLLLAHNSNEGAIFTDPAITTAIDFYSSLRDLIPTTSTPVFNYIIQELYPPIFNDTTGKYPYTNNFERAELVISEAVIICNTDYIARAFNNQTYNYIFSYPPGFHGEDVAYTFFEPDSMGMAVGSNPYGPVNASIATVMQDYITSFAATGNPNVGSLGVEEGPGEQFLDYGETGRAQNLSAVGVGMVIDPARNERCSWWQQALYY